MKIKVTKTKTGCSVRITAAKKGPEAADLGEAVMSIVGKGRLSVKVDTLTGILGHLKEKGYEADGLLSGEATTVNLTRKDPKP